MSTTTTTDRTRIRERYLGVDTSNVADVLDELGLVDQGLAAGFAPFPASAGRLAGFAFTIQGQHEPYALGGGDAEKMAACGAVTPDSVTVWSGGARGVCLFGELIALGLRERGCVGALVDGGVRDVGWLGRHGFCTYARYRTPIQSIGRWKVHAWEVPVSMPGATRPQVPVAPGDFVLGDDDGVIVIPAAAVVDVLERAEAMGRREQEIRSHIADGLSLSSALERFGHV